MANLITELTARIEEYRATNKNPCKNYATEKATKRMAQIAATHFDRQGRKDAPEARYVVFYIAAWGRWVGVIDLSELMNRPNSMGGYLGITAGFFSF